MRADTQAGTIGRTIRIIAGASLTRRTVTRLTVTRITGAQTISAGRRAEIIEATIDLPAAETTGHQVASVGLRGDSMGPPEDKPQDNDSVGSVTRINIEDRISSIRTGRKERRYSRR